MQPSPAAAVLELEAEAGFTLPEPRAERIAGVRVGRLVGLTAAGAPLVDFPGNPALAGVEAVAAAAVGVRDLGREVVLAFADGDPARPVLLGLVSVPDAPAAGVAAQIDGERLVFTAEREIVLRCGAASITLTRGGKVLISGDYVLTRADGVNRIKGGSVQIN